MDPPIKSTKQQDWDNYFKAQAKQEQKERTSKTRKLKADPGTFQHTLLSKVNGVWKDMPLFSFGDVIVEAKQGRVVEQNEYKSPNRKAERNLIHKANRKKG